MNSAELWEAYSTRNPSFNGDGQVTMSAAGLRKLFEQTWSIAYDSGHRTGRREGQREAAAAASRTYTHTSSPMDIFSTVFGQK